MLSRVYQLLLFSIALSNCTPVNRLIRHEIWSQAIEFPSPKPTDSRHPYAQNMGIQTKFSQAEEVGSFNLHVNLYQQSIAYTNSIKLWISHDVPKDKKVPLGYRYLIEGAGGVSLTREKEFLEFHAERQAYAEEEINFSELPSGTLKVTAFLYTLKDAEKAASKYDHRALQEALSDAFINGDSSLVTIEFNNRVQKSYPFVHILKRQFRYFKEAFNEDWLAMTEDGIFRLPISSVVFDSFLRFAIKGELEHKSVEHMTSLYAFAGVTEFPQLSWAIANHLIAEKDALSLIRFYKDAELGPSLDDNILNEQIGLAVATQIKQLRQ